MSALPDFCDGYNERVDAQPAGLRVRGAAAVVLGDNDFAAHVDVSVGPKSGHFGKRAWSSYLII
jgi:hypothetical protein